MGQQGGTLRWRSLLVLAVLCGGGIALAVLLLDAGDDR
jgi:hypothetical protein